MTTPKSPHAIGPVNPNAYLWLRAQLLSLSRDTRRLQERVLALRDEVERLYKLENKD